MLDAQLRTDLGAMLSRLQQQHVCSVTPLLKPVCEPKGCECTPGTVAGGWGYRGDAHIGEASHPGPKQWLPAVFSSSFEPSLRCCLLQILVAAVAVLSICDGMGCAALSLQNCNMSID